MIAVETSYKFYAEEILRITVNATVLFLLSFYVFAWFCTLFCKQFLCSNLLTISVITT